MKDRVTGDPRGFAFVVFGEGSTVDLVMAEAKHEINHKVVDVKRAQARGIAPPSIHEKREAEAAAATATATAAQDTNQPNRPNNKLTPEQLHNKVFVGGTSNCNKVNEKRKRGVSSQQFQIHIAFSFYEDRHPSQC
jgi:RNA-binding protein Musashi